MLKVRFLFIRRDPDVNVFGRSRDGFVFFDCVRNEVASVVAFGKDKVDFTGIGPTSESIGRDRVIFFSDRGRDIHDKEGDRDKRE